MKNTANGGNNRAPQYRTKESNVAVQRRGSANPSLASIVAPYSPCANSSFVSSWGVFRIPVRSKMDAWESELPAIVTRGGIVGRTNALVPRT